jgi:5-methylcytosine-specific restriction protein A
MSRKIPNGITRKHIVEAIRDLDRGVDHPFGESTGYDVLFEGRRYPPKAVVGLAVGKLTGRQLGPSDFSGGIKSRCVQVLKAADFAIVSKGDTRRYPDEVSEEDVHVEGAVKRVTVNSYERNDEARARAIDHYGLRCQVCDFNFKSTYGALGEGFIHVHHTVPLSQIGKSYVVDPIADLRPVCPNCHAMLHKRMPPYTVEELRALVSEAAAGGSSPPPG